MILRTLLSRCATVALTLSLVGTALAQSTRPAGSGELSLRAQQSFIRGEYALALPMLQKVEQQLKDQPDQLAAVQEQIRVCQKNLINSAATGGAAKPQSTELRKPHVRPKDDETLELSIKDLGNFDYDADKGGNIPADVQQLNGCTVRLRGFMIPIDQAEKITQFALVPSLFACCFGQPPQVQHTIVVNCPKGKAVGYFPDEISVEGTLKVEEKKDEGFIVSVFEMQASSVKPMPK